MAKSKGITTSKKDREKKKLQKRKEKEQKRLARKESNLKGEGFDAMISYVDQFGNLTDTPPDPNMKVEVDHSTIELGVPKREEEDPIKDGVVDFFNQQKGFGFIKLKGSDQKYFFHISNVDGEEIKENNLVKFEIERGHQGYTAVRIKKA